MRIGKKTVTTLLAFLICAAISVSSCGLIGGNNEGEEIEEVVSEFLDSVMDGTYTKDDYKSSFTKDKSFSKLKFEDKDAEKLMEISFGKIEYEIKDAGGDRKDEEGTCEVKLTFVDLEKIVEDYEDGFDYETIRDAIEDKKAPADDVKIVFEMEYDEEEWQIKDLSDLIDLIGEPYAELCFKTPIPDPKEVAEELLNAVRTSDFSAVETLTGGLYSEADFIQEDWASSKDLFDCVFGAMTWKIGDVPDASETECSIPVKITHEDYFSAGETIYNDDDEMIAALKPYVLSYAKGDDDTRSYDIYSDSLTQALIRSIGTSGQKKTVDESVELYFDEALMTWQVTYIPETLLVCSEFAYYIDPLNSPLYATDPERVNELLIRAADALLADGLLTQQQYDDMRTDENPDQSAYTKESVEAVITEQGWFDYSTNTFVSSYGPNTSDIGYVFFFDRFMPGLTLYVEFFSTGGTVSVYSDALTLAEDEDLADFGITSSSVFPKDTYRVVIKLSDGTVLTDATVNVTE